ncbi:MAG: sugar ABC transporter permease [Syntrophaceae bacterium]|nr:sugar ABC transporter permease [Syntrophaceae bacterium]
MKKKNLGPLLVSPALVLIVMLLVFPVFFSFYFGLFKVEFLKIVRYTGLENFSKLLRNSEIIKGIVRSLILSLSAVAISILAGFILAYWINKRKGLGAYVIQLVGLIPWVTSMVISALIWKWIFNGELALFNYFRKLLGLKSVLPLENPASAMATLIFTVAWRTIGYSMIMILAGLKTVPIELLEAGKVDGASAIQQVFYIQLPMIKTPMLLSTIVVTLSNMNNVTVPMVLTGGGPAKATNVISLELYRMGFTYYNFGEASTLAFVVFGLNVLLVYSYIRMVKWHV